MTLWTPTPVQWRPDLSAGSHYVFGDFKVGPSLWNVRWRRTRSGEDWLVSPLTPCCSGHVMAVTVGMDRFITCGDSSCSNRIEPVLVDVLTPWLAYSPPDEPERGLIAVWLEQAYSMNTLEEELAWSCLTSWPWDEELLAARAAADSIDERLAAERSRV